MILTVHNARGLFGCTCSNQRWIRACFCTLLDVFTRFSLDDIYGTSSTTNPFCPTPSFFSTTLSSHVHITVTIPGPAFCTDLIAFSRLCRHLGSLKKTKNEKRKKRVKRLEKRCSINSAILESHLSTEVQGKCLESFWRPRQLDALDQLPWRFANESIFFASPIVVQSRLVSLCAVNAISNARGMASTSPSRHSAFFSFSFFEQYRATTNELFSTELRCRVSKIRQLQLWTNQTIKKHSSLKRFSAARESIEVDVNVCTVPFHRYQF